MHTFSVSEECATQQKSTEFWFQKGDFPNNKGKIMKTGGFLLQKKTEKSLNAVLLFYSYPIFTLLRKKKLYNKGQILALHVTLKVLYSEILSN